MLKQLTLVVLAGALLPACILTTDDTTTSVSESSSSDGTTVATSTDPTTGLTDPSDGTTTNEQTTDATTTTAPTTTDGTTTDAPTTDATTTVATTTDGTTTDATTGQGGDYGKCGWFAADKYYACESDGAVASLEDPDGISPIACDPTVEEGGKCSEDEGPVKGVGCCTPEGVLYYCDSEGAQTIVKQDCGL